MMTDTIPETPGEVPQVAQLEASLKENSEDVIQKIKWQMAFTKRVKDEARTPLNPGELNSFIDGLLRAELSERLSATLQMDECETAYASPGSSTEGLKVASFREITGHRSKEQVLTFAVEKSLKEAPPAALQRYFKRTYSDEEMRGDFYLATLQDIVDGYTAQGSNGGAGIFFGETVIPDAALVSAGGEAAGFVEVKAYFPDELEALVDYLRSRQKAGRMVSPKGLIGIRRDGKTRTFSLGVDLDGEILFVDTFRQAGYGLEPLGAAMPAVLRFPKDNSDEQLKRFGEILTTLHYPNVVIQKLPITSGELSRLGRKFVAANLAKFKTKDTKFIYSDREIRVLEVYSADAQS
jgi:hypothetical protein